ncbi:MAG TPA: deoxyribodipyrimidine photo-lyase [Solirubrobacteraceae bacterium]|nr:deoxyribodipyrimidine photo-lyase [Solirubrobacteraceae bacterium]
MVLFTRDLRVRDNDALATAVREHDRVVPLFVLDDALLRRNCGAPNRLAFLHDCLADLHDALARRGARLLVRRGEVVRETLALARECGVRAIHISADATPYASAREQRLREACKQERIALRVHDGVTAVAPGALTPSTGDHYRVFTPYWRAWRVAAMDAAHAAPAPRRVQLPRGTPDARLPPLRELVRGTPSPDLPRGGESEGRRALDAFIRRGGLASYEDLHDDLAAARTSRLGAHLHFGCLSPATAIARVADRPGAEAFVRQLCWRDFHHQVLAARPDLPRADYRPRGDRWRRDARAAAAWRDGRTGYPIVDAGMRQLQREGFMHNRARMIVASFLVKTLYLYWRLGAAHFSELLCDADVANNVGNWQWVAGTGNDTRPNRVLNPLRQAARFDRDGEYVRRYVPELAGVDGRAVHEPWLLPRARRRALANPAPINDHERAARELRARRS